MGELLLGRPIVQLHHRISQPLDLLCYISLLFRSVPGSGVSPGLISARRGLDQTTNEDIDLLNGFSGRRLYYLEEPVLSFEPLRNDQSATFDELLAYLEKLDSEDFRSMAIRSIQRVHRDLKSSIELPDIGDTAGWREYILPALTTATVEDTYRLLQQPEELKERTVRLLAEVWSAYADTYQQGLAANEEARRLAETHSSQGFGLAFSELTGNRLPATLASRMNEIEDVVFLPSQFVGGFVSFVIYPPHVFVNYSAPELLVRHATSNGRSSPILETVQLIKDDCLEEEELLEALKALSDPNRLRIVEMLTNGELYAQEIVGQLSVAQSAVSRHLSLLERSGLITVTPRRGMKYYSIDRERLTLVSQSLLGRCM